MLDELSKDQATFEQSYEGADMVGKNEGAVTPSTHTDYPKFDDSFSDESFEDIVEHIYRNRCKNLKLNFNNKDKDNDGV